jgi:hypothetical protein
MSPKNRQRGKHKTAYAALTKQAPGRAVAYAPKAGDVTVSGSS